MGPTPIPVNGNEWPLFINLIFGKSMCYIYFWTTNLYENYLKNCQKCRQNVVHCWFDLHFPSGISRPRKVLKIPPDAWRRHFYSPSSSSPPTGSAVHAGCSRRRNFSKAITTVAQEATRNREPARIWIHANMPGVNIGPECSGWKIFKTEERTINVIQLI